VKNPRYAYVMVPLVLVVIWAAVYVPWVRRYHPLPNTRFDRLPPAVFVPPQIKPEALPADVIAMRSHYEEMKAQWISLVFENLRPRLRGPPPDAGFRYSEAVTHNLPNQSPEPVLSSGTSPAGQEPRHP
jgi:hypothetical protein